MSVIFANAKPFLKWVGGKRALVPEILERLPGSCRRYYEPFVGGGAVFFAYSGRFERAVLGDTNPELITAYVMLRDSPELVCKLLSKWPTDADTYYKIRALAPNPEKPVERAARCIYLNRTCFNGLWRENASGQFNVPYGKRDVTFDFDVLMEAGQALADAEIECEDFETLMRSARQGDVVYCDPPYDATFDGFAPGGFSWEDQERLVEAARKAAERGAHVVLSNSDTPRVRKLYRARRVERVTAPRRVAARTSSRGNVQELLITIAK